MKLTVSAFLSLVCCFCLARPVGPPSLESMPEVGSLPPVELAPHAERDFDFFLKLDEKSIESFLVFEGLPHPMWERELHQNELVSKERIEIAKHPFYKDAIEVSGSSATSLLALMLDADLFTYYSGGKFCGGFHPDVAIKADSIVIQVCFGCHEMKIIEEGAEYPVDMKDGTKELLKKAFASFRRHRPVSEFSSGIE